MKPGLTWKIVSRHVIVAFFATACGGANAASYGAAGGIVQTAIYRKVSGYSCCVSDVIR